MRHVTLVIAFISIAATCVAQKFRGESPVPKVETDGFYRIAVTPDLTTHLNENFTNIRIIDSKGGEVPYLFQQEKPTYHSLQFKPYTIIDKKQTKGCCTTLILNNPTSEPINNISLSIKNAEVTKEATLLGSDDQTNWFALKEHFFFTSINNREQTSEVKIVDFPLSNYSFYKLQINDSTNAPINILSAGYFEVSSESGKFTQLPVKIVSSENIREKRTHLKIQLDTTQVIDKISISMKGAPYFLRIASVNEQKQRKTKKGDVETWLEELATFELSSKGPSVIELPNTKIKEYIVLIENEDNPSLEVSEVKVFQLNRYLTAYLKKGEAYSINIGSLDLRAPVYDIEYFKDSIPQQITTLNAGALVIVDEMVKQQSKTFFSSKMIIWGAIIVVIVVLGFMALKMINETNVEKS